MSGASFPRPFCSVEHVRALIQTAATSTSSSASSTSSSSSPHSFRRVGPAVLWFRGRGAAAQVLRRQGCGGSFSFGQQDVIRQLTHPSPKQPLSLPLKLRGRFREGGADSESRDGNPQRISRRNSTKKEPSLLLSLIQEIQPLDVSQISKDASTDSTDAMKRTISGMLGLLPSDQFHVTVETSREPLMKLLVSSMMTGYTLRNAEYRLCLQKSLESDDDDGVKCIPDDQCATSENPVEDLEDRLVSELQSIENEYASRDVDENDADVEAETLRSLGHLSEEAKKYILSLQKKLTLTTKELEDLKRISTGLQVQSIVGEEKNDLLDYLRSLAPDKVAELSQPTSPEVENVIQHVIDGLMDDPLTKIHHKESQFGNLTATVFNEEDGHQTFSSPLQSQSALIVNRDHLARLLFWCMLLGHHMRGLEYRLELMRTLSLSGDLEDGITEVQQEG